MAIQQVVESCKEDGLSNTENKSYLGTVEVQADVLADTKASKDEFDVGTGVGDRSVSHHHHNASPGCSESCSTFIND